MFYLGGAIVALLSFMLVLGWANWRTGGKR
jgi:hypothetical protein